MESSRQVWRWRKRARAAPVEDPPKPSLADEPSLALALEAEDAIASGVPVQVLIEGYSSWLAITDLGVHHGRDLLQASLHDGSTILFGARAIIGVRFGQIEENGD